MLRDSVARVLPIWESSSSHRPLKSHLYGMHAFGLGETNMVPQAEKQARLGLELNEHDAWATHALVHTIEYMGQTSEGINFLEKTDNHWHQCDIIAPHIDWHWALYELEQDNWEKAEEILQHHFLNNNGTELNRIKYTDAASLIYRLKLAGHPCSSQSNSQLKQFLDVHLRDHQTLFQDFHHYFVLDNFADTETKKDFLRSLKETVESSDTDTGKAYREIGSRIFAALERFDEGDYAQVVELLYPIRYRTAIGGGSIAQRDIFTLLLIHSAVYSNNNQHQQLAKRDSVTMKLSTMWRNMTYEKAVRIMSLGMKHAGGMKRAVKKIEFLINLNGGLYRYAPFQSTLPFYQRYMFDLAIVTIVVYLLDKYCKRNRQKKVDWY
ncbi:unnamed protein product [Rotaria sordida]|nr:unnamed protein product [Rotaria sordida]